MSHVPDNAQNASGAPLPPQLKGDADRHRGMRSVDETLRSVTVTRTKLNVTARVRKVLVRVPECFRNSCLK